MNLQNKQFDEFSILKKTYFEYSLLFLLLTFVFVIGIFIPLIRTDYFHLSIPYLVITFLIFINAISAYLILIYKKGN